MHVLPRPDRPWAARLLLLVALALALAACDAGHGFNPAPDQLPTLTLTSGPVDTVSAPQSWLVDIGWIGSDPDGRIDHYEYAIDPPRLKQARLSLAETTWVKTTENHVVARFRASHADSLGPGATASEFHTFVLRAVDDRGGKSPNVVRAFYAWTVAPDVQINDPHPNPLLVANVGNPFQLSWSGRDPDGAGTTQPAAYRLRFLSLSDPGNLGFLVDPDSLRRRAVETSWEGWLTVGGDTTSLTIRDLPVNDGQGWLVAIVAVDDAGASTPYMDLNRNLLTFRVTASSGPRIEAFGGTGGFVFPPNDDPTNLDQAWTVEAPAQRVLQVAWNATASPGRRVTGTRWVLDPADVNDETPRTDPVTDWSHWSPFTSILPISVTFGPLAPGDHLFYIEARDNFGARRFGIIRLVCTVPQTQRDLLVVDDTRLEPDKFSGVPGRPNPYTQPWPSAAELDTFLFARGGVPWRGTQAPPSGVLSPPGLLAGYAFDTLGTRRGLENPATSVSLVKLSQYRHVLWITDQKSALGTGPGSTELRAICAPGQVNVLGTYVRNGGQLWLVGGGSALASLIDYNLTTNDQNDMLFTFEDGELKPGRMIYDFAHVRSALGVATTSGEPQRSAAAIGGWSGEGPERTLDAPDYARLPASLRFRDAASDPIPPTRLASQGALFYRTNTSDEFVPAPNEITEDLDPTDGVHIGSTLDTLFEVSSQLITTPNAPVMTYYHGLESAPFVFSGFDLWSWSRADCQGLVDFVLGDIWKLTKAPGASVHPVGSPARVQRAAAPRLSAGLDPRRMRP